MRIAVFEITPYISGMPYTAVPGFPAALSTFDPGQNRCPGCKAFRTRTFTCGGCRNSFCGACYEIDPNGCGSTLVCPGCHTAGEVDRAYLRELVRDPRFTTDDTERCVMRPMSTQQRRLAQTVYRCVYPPPNLLDALLAAGIALVALILSFAPEGALAALGPVALLVAMFGPRQQRETRRGRRSVDRRALRRALDDMHAVGRTHAPIGGPICEFFREIDPALIRILEEHSRTNMRRRDEDFAKAAGRKGGAGVLTVLGED
jgi:hypothetical protein